MKKQIIYFALTLFVFSFFACDFDFQIPQNVQIKGSREIKLTTSMPLADMIHEQLIGSLGSDGQFKILKATQGDQLTYVIHMDVMPGGMEIDVPFNFTDFFDTSVVVDVVKDKITSGDLLENIDHEEVGILVSDLEAGIGKILEDLELQLNDMVEDIELDGLSEFPVSFDFKELISNIFTGSSDISLADSLVEAIIEAAEDGVISVAKLTSVITDTVVEKIEEAIVVHPLVLEENIVLPGFEDPIAIPSLGIVSDFLKNFKLSDDFDAQLYLSVKDKDGNGISFFNKIMIDLAWDDQFDPDDDENFIENVKPSSNDPGDAFSGETFTASKLPTGIPLADLAMELLKQKAPAEEVDGEEGRGVYIRIYIDSIGDDPFYLDFLNKSFTVTAELAIILPLEIGVEMEGKHPLFDGLPDGEDILGRSLEDLEGGGMMGDIIEAVKVLAFKIEFNKPVFNGLKLIIENRGFPDHFFEITLSDKKLEVKFPDSFIEKINNPDYYPFIPDVFLDCAATASIKIPKDLKLEKVALDVTFETKPMPILGGF